MNEQYLELIKKISKRKHIAQNELARRTGCCSSSMSNYLNGKSEMPFSIGIAIAKELHIDLNSLFDINAIKMILDDNEQDLLETLREIPEDKRRSVIRSFRRLVHCFRE